MATTNLNITQLTGSQNQKYVTINEALESLDAATQGTYTATVVGATTLTNAQFRGSFAFILGGTPGAFTLTVPAVKRLFAVVNNTDGAATVEVDSASGETVDVAADSASLCYSDGTDVYAVGGGSGGSGGAVAITDETIAVIAAATGIDFAGAGVTVTDDGDDTVTVTIPGLSDAPARTGVFRGARVNNSSSDLALAGSTFEDLDFDTAEFDTTSFWESVTNPNRFTIPTGYGITKVRVSLFIRVDDLSTSNGWIVPRILKNGSEVVRGGEMEFSGDDRAAIQLSTEVIEVTDGDYFSMQVFAGEASTFDAQSFATIEVLEDQSNTGPNSYAQSWSVPSRGAVAYLTADNTSQDLSTFTDYAWDTTDYDTDDFWDGAQPSRFTIPAGVTKVRLSGRINVTGGLVGDTASYVVIQKNGSNNYHGCGMFTGRVGYTNQLPSVTTGVVDVVEGDYFTLDIGIAGETSETVASTSSYFQIEVVETSDAQARLFDVQTFVPGTPTAGAIVLQSVMTRAATLKADAPAAQAFASTVSTAAAEFDITKNGAAVGTVNFALGASTGTFTVASDVTFVAGDRVAIVAPDPQDTTLADVSITLPIAIG